MLSLGVLGLLLGCPASSSPADPLAVHGQQVYQSTCIACHNANPALDGSVGPAVKGASRALLEERLLRAAYPAGYAPKRSTRLMPAQPHLASSLDALAAYLK
jgi:mono/diheme cytochrome c family protein